MPVIDIAPTPIYISECSFHDRVKSLFLEEIEKHDGHKNPLSEGLTHIDHYSVLSDDKFSRFKTWVEQCAEDFVVNTLGYYLPENMQVSDSWINICQENGWQEPHYHANATISCVYYVNFEQGKHADTYFAARPRLGLASYPSSPLIQMVHDRETKYNQFDCVTGQEGCLFMWESHVLHGFKPNIHPDRVTVAMNLIPTVVSNGDYGWRVNHLTPEERKISADKWAEGKLWDTPNVFPQDGLPRDVY